MKQELFAINEERAKEFLSEKFDGFFKSLPYLKYGYTFTALQKILQADVPVALAAERLDPEEIEFLKQSRKNICVISIDKAWRTLLENDIMPDFIMGDAAGEDGFDLRLNRASLIVNAESENACLKEHQGKQFFYWSKNPLVKVLCEDAQKKSDYPYRYNMMQCVPETEDSYQMAVYVADYMNASFIILLGGDGRKAEGFQNEKLLCMHGADGHAFEAVKKMCNIECHIGETAGELYPLLDDGGREEFDRLARMWAEEAKDTVLHIRQSIGLYHQLYRMAAEETVCQDDLNRVVTMLNQCAEAINQNRHSPYVMQIANELEAVSPEQKDALLQNANEIATIAAENTWVYEKIQVIFDFLITRFSDLEIVSKSKNEDRSALKHCQSVLLVYGPSQYQVLANFIEKMKKGFQILGYSVYLWGEDWTTSLGYNIYQNSIGYDYIILMNGVDSEVKFCNPVSRCHQFWYENPNTKVAAIFVDHPRMHIDRIGFMGRRVQVFLPDKYWCEYVKNYMPELLEPYYLPMGGVAQDNVTDFEEKENKIVFFGSQHSLDTLSQKINQSLHKDFIWVLIGELIAHPQYTVEGMAREMGIRHHCPDSMDSLILRENIIWIVSDYMRHYFREKAIMEIIRSGIPIDVYGWKSEEAAHYDNVTFKEKVDFEEMLRICQNTKFVLNVNPWTKDGVQERVFNAMLGGSVAVTDTSEFLEREFQDGENIALYRLDEIEKLPETIKYYMAHPDQAKKIAENGYQIAREKHTWEIRAKEMMELWK